MILHSLSIDLAFSEGQHIPFAWVLLPRVVIICDMKAVASNFYPVNACSISNLKAVTLYTAFSEKDTIT